MATAEREQRTTFIRQDGKDKVTGLGRYTADLTFTGMLHAKFRLLRPRARADPAPGYGRGARAARRLRGGHRRRRAGRPLRRRSSRTARCSPATSSASRARWWPPSPRSRGDRRAGGGADRGRLRAAARRHRSRGGAGRRGAVGPRRLGVVRRARGRGPRTATTLALDDRQGRRGARRWPRPTSSCSERYVADMSHAAPIEPRAVVAQWNGDKVTIWSSTQVPFNARAGVATTLEMPESDVRSSCPTWAAASAASASSTSRRTSRRWPGPPGGRCGWSSRAREEFLAPDHRREGQVIELETGVHAATARCSPGGRGWCWTTAPTRPTTRSSRSWRR